MVRSFVFASVASIALAGCDIILGLDDLEADRGGGADQGGGSSTTGAGGGCMGPFGSPGCGACPEPNIVVVMTAAGTFAIDKNEVTNAEYQTFLASDPSLSLAPMPDCAANTSFEPGVPTQAGYADPLDYDQAVTSCAAWSMTSADPDKPIACVDWCDAAAYCAWAGKRLCGELEGGAIDVTMGPGPHADPTVSEWFAACTGPSLTDYPYGDTYMAVCNDIMSGTEPVDAWDGCVGGYPGIRNMSGNVGEWENACTDYQSPEELQNCLLRGGSWYHLQDGLRCDAYRDVPRYNMGDGIGIRCCADAG